METHHMMGIHHVENSDRNKNNFSFLNILLHFKVCCSSAHDLRVRRKKFRTAGFVMQNFLDKARKLRHRQSRDKCALNLKFSNFLRKKVLAFSVIS